MRGLTLAALGVVFGDIGTSPLYTLRECFGEGTGLAPTPENVYGILSLITWALISVVTLKYVLVVMRADNKGEGGVLALMALLTRSGTTRANWRRATLFLGVAGAALFFGDALLTPAISVLSAIEGLNVATPAFEPLVVPISLGVLFALFVVQRYGTGSVGRLFGPITAVWFIVLIALGASEIVGHPGILQALSPHYAIRFCLEHGWATFIALGAVTLAVTGAEALYADMGHFGRKPIRYAWLGLVLPALLINYFGQGALILRDVSAIANPFYLLAPSWALYPLVALATMATVIASQAVISGAFSMVQQASLLGLFPRVRILHTSAAELGQIYVPAVNWLQLFGIVMLVISFRSSSNLASAYGIAVTGTMLIDTILITMMVTRIWRWGWVKTAASVGLFFAVDATLVSANMLKMLHGGWVPLALAILIFTAMWTWLRGRRLIAKHERETALPIGQFLAGITPGKISRPQGTAIYLTALKNDIPPSLLHNLKHNEVLHEHVVLLTVEVPDVPVVPAGERAQVEHLGKGMHRVVLRYGFIENPNVPNDLTKLGDKGIPLDPMRTSYFVGRNTFVPSTRSEMPRWQERLFLILSKTASNAPDFFNLPTNRVVELGSRIEV